MIVANEVYVIEALKDLGIEDKKIVKILEELEGWRIYFRKKPTEYERIKSIYNAMLKNGVKRADAIKRLSELFEKSISSIRVIVRKQESIFDVCE